MHAKYQYAIIHTSEDMSQNKVFLWQTDGRTDGQTDEWVLMSPDFVQGGEQKYT